MIFSVSAFGFVVLVTFIVGLNYLLTVLGFLGFGGLGCPSESKFSFLTFGFLCLGLETFFFLVYFSESESLDTSS